MTSAAVTWERALARLVGDNALIERRSLTRGAVTSTAPALARTSRGWVGAVAHQQSATVLVALGG